MADGSVIRVGALVPMSRPGWVEAGRHLLAGLELGVRDFNSAGGVAGVPLELLVCDTAADPQRAAVAIEEFDRQGVAVVVGEYHSVVARAAAASADALGIPFLCSSSVLDELTDKPSEWVARLAPAQSHSWQIYADFLLDMGHRHIGVASEPSVYWASGTKLLRDYLSNRGGSVLDLNVRDLDPEAIGNELVQSGVSALLLLVGYPEPAASVVKSVRQDHRIAEIMLGAPAGQPEFADWSKSLGDSDVAIPFLRYLPERLSPLGSQVKTALRDVLGDSPSFVAFEGYDTVAVLAELLKLCGPDRARIAQAWTRVTVRGTRGTITFTHTPGISVWQWAWPPVQVVASDPQHPGSLRVLHAG